MKQSQSNKLDFSSINSDHSINSGQVFLWKKLEDRWYGVNGQDILRIDKDNSIFSYKGRKIDFWRENDDVEKILTDLSKDKILEKAIRKYVGLRILRQDPFQCLVSFIVSSNSNILKIKSCLEKLCKNFGNRIEFDGIEFYTFPTPEKLASLEEGKIKNCGVGYRAKFILDASKSTVFKKINFEYLKKCSYCEAKKIIKEIPGIGDKVADCILLFSLEKLESFPLDRWMIKILQKYYSDVFQIKSIVTERQYKILHEKIVNHFGPFGGYAQQFLFKMERENFQKKW